MSAKKDEKTTKNQVETTGHSWDGIEELDNPLPRWWLWFFYGTIAFAILWTILYPAWPMIHGATQGILGWDSRKVVQEDIAAIAAQNKPLDDALKSSTYQEITADKNLSTYAISGGEAIFGTYCAQCHGLGAAGSPGYPNLIDNDWLWGGTYENIEYTIRHGIRDTKDPETRESQMPPFDGIFSDEDLTNLVAYVQSLSTEPDNETADLAAGGQIFAENCTACHLENGQGDITQGSANLTDVIWLYGGDEATIRQTILKGRDNVMPHWGEKFDDAQIKQAVMFVHSRGGGQ